MAIYDGPASFLTPDGQLFEATVHAGQRGEQWNGTIQLQENQRRLEQGDVCQLTAKLFGDLRIIITEQRGGRRYAFISLVRPDPGERLGPPP